MLYRSAKQDPQRRFHALYDKVARSDVMWKAWVNVTTNGGAPGVDGVSIASIDADGVAGVRRFLDALAAGVEGQDLSAQAVAEGVYPQAGQDRGTPTARHTPDLRSGGNGRRQDHPRPIFEGDFLGVSFGFRPKRSTHQALEVIRQTANRGAATRDQALVVADLNPVLRGWGNHYRYGNSARQFHTVDSYVRQRLARLTSVKHGLSGRNWVTRFNYALSQLGIHRLTGTVRYWSAHA